ncbi:Hypothetical protein PHPALM_17659 [Phytophthora palmivora]|uniref:Uncharacterized protein n=1 Tax=Phytophthora palmivora TaxID=4796 RepID=A0A2P4XLN7_9STRA|nr:Hypothetical protein PHPALM_17659 [Phytophthora palmivora]
MIVSVSLVSCKPTRKVNRADVVGWLEPVLALVCQAARLEHHHIRELAAMEGTLSSLTVSGAEAEDVAERSGTDTNESGVEMAPPHGGGRGGRGAGRGGRGGRGATTRPAASWSDADVSEFFRFRYAELADNFKRHQAHQISSTLSVNQIKLFTDQQCQSKENIYNVKISIDKSPY